MTRVRAHKVRRNGKVFTRREHERTDPPRRKTLDQRLEAWTLSPRRAVRNARRSRRLVRVGKHGRAALYASAASCELAAWTVLKPIGSVMVVSGGIIYAVTRAMKEQRAA